MSNFATLRVGSQDCSRLPDSVNTFDRRTEVNLFNTFLICLSSPSTDHLHTMAECGAPSVAVKMLRNRTKKELTRTIWRAQTGASDRKQLYADTVGGFAHQSRMTHKAADNIHVVQEQLEHTGSLTKESWSRDPVGVPKGLNDRYGL